MGTVEGGQDAEAQSRPGVRAAKANYREASPRGASSPVASSPIASQPKSTGPSGVFAVKSTWPRPQDSLGRSQDSLGRSVDSLPRMPGKPNRIAAGSPPASSA